MIGSRLVVLPVGMLILTLALWPLAMSGLLLVAPAYFRIGSFQGVFYLVLLLIRKIGLLADLLDLFVFLAVLLVCTLPLGYCCCGNRADDVTWRYR